MIRGECPLSFFSAGWIGHRAEIESFKYAAGEQPLNCETRKLPVTTKCTRPSRDLAAVKYRHCRTAGN
jgi:hypothetical protein